MSHWKSLNSKKFQTAESRYLCAIHVNWLQFYIFSIFFVKSTYMFCSMRADNLNNSKHRNIFCLRKYGFSKNRGKGGDFLKKVAKRGKFKIVEKKGKKAWVWLPDSFHFFRRFPSTCAGTSPMSSRAAYFVWKCPSH